MSDRFPHASRKKVRFGIQQISITIGASILLCGCVFSYPTDVRLLSIEKVTQADIFQQRGLLYDTNLGQPMLKVYFASYTDLLDYGMDSYGIGVTAEFCSEKDRVPGFVGSPSPNLAWNAVYSGGLDLGKQISESGRISHPDAKPNEAAKKPQPVSEKSNEMLYYAYVFPFRAAPPLGPWSHPEQAWNLIESPHDICLRVGVLKQYLLPRRSNLIRIPANLISAALLQ